MLPTATSEQRLLQNLNPEQLEELVQSLPVRFGDAIAEVLEQIERELLEGQPA